MPMFDFKCTECDVVSEDIVPVGTKSIECPECGSDAELVFISPPSLPTVITVSYPGCKKHKAGYVHTHGDKDATKIQSGYGGCQGPKPGVNNT